MFDALKLQNKIDLMLIDVEKLNNKVDNLAKVAESFDKSLDAMDRRQDILFELVRRMIEDKEES